MPQPTQKWDDWLKETLQLAMATAPPTPPAAKLIEKSVSEKVRGWAAAPPPDEHPDPNTAPPVPAVLPRNSEPVTLAEMPSR